MVTWYKACYLTPAHLRTILIKVINGEKLMKTIHQITSKLSAITLLLFISTNSALAAGGTVTFTLPGPASIPTLSGTMLILLSVLLCVVAFRTAKLKKSNINKLFITLLGTGVLVTASSGVKLVSDAHAGGGFPINFSGDVNHEISQW